MSDPSERLRTRVRDEYDAGAAAYERRWNRYVARTARQTIGRLPREGITSVLDVGCGTGWLLSELAAQRPDCRITGVDLSPAMTAAARQRLPRHAVLATADAEHLPFASRSFDAVVSASSFHFWPDPHAALRECRRVLRPSGVLVVTDWCDDFLLCRVCDRLLRIRYGSTHRVYGGEECERLLAGAGFEPVRIDRYRISWLWGMMTAVAKIRL